mmetsp:Transcript_98378/g.298578  ORF Transcript_98378/g.298578 Transcript_98378/m.298578 type:complete len:241 (+) Transcript_98378:2-724(+)
MAFWGGAAGPRLCLGNICVARLAEEPREQQPHDQPHKQIMRCKKQIEQLLSLAGQLLLHESLYKRAIKASEQQLSDETLGRAMDKSPGAGALFSAAVRSSARPLTISPHKCNKTLRSLCAQVGMQCLLPGGPVGPCQLQQGAASSSPEGHALPRWSVPLVLPLHPGGRWWWQASAQGQRHQGLDTASQHRLRSRYHLLSAGEYPFQELPSEGHPALPLNARELPTITERVSNGVQECLLH